ncbi:MAG TPA: 2-dehydropantoate 2-reductase N-terminal domain-containing protein [Polyangiales bacterium]
MSTTRPAGSPAVLIVGAGCVGQVFGYHLARGGAQVSFLVRPKYREALTSGYALQRLRLGRSARSLRVAPLPLFDQLDQLAAQRFELVLLTISSAALDADWLRVLLAQVGAATIVSLQPDPADHALIEAALDERAKGAGAAVSLAAPALVRGNVGFVAFDAPLPAQAWPHPPGTAFWFPPSSRSIFSGPAPAVAALLAPLRRGGLPARRVADVSRSMAFPNALGMTYLLALEACAWSIDRLRADPVLDSCEQALREAIAIVRRRLGSAPLGVGLLTRTRLVAWGFGLASAFVPFPLLGFVARHFTKVAAQTHLIVSRLVAEGERAGLATANLRTLLARAGQAPHQLR